MRFTGIAPEAVADAMDGKLRENPEYQGRLEAYLPSPCVQNHAANLAFLPDGTLTCVWFGGTMEGMGDISIYMSRLAPGSDTWSAPEKMTDDPAKSEQNPLIFQAPDGKIRLLYTSQTAGDQDGAVVKCRISEDRGTTFGPPEVLCDLPGTFVRQPVIVNDDGAWLLPTFRCVSEPGHRWTGAIDTAGVLISRDRGNSWQMVDVADSIGAVHMNIVPLGDGRMAAFYRDRFAGNIQASFSRDSGESWSAPEPTNLPNNNSSIQATRLRDGRIAIVYNHSSAADSSDRRESLYDEIESDKSAIAEGPAPTSRRAIWGVPRAPLSLAISKDDGQSFSRVADLDTGTGYCLSNNSKDMLNREFSYPTIVEGPDGSLHIAYTYYRRAIKHVRLAKVPAG